MSNLLVLKQNLHWHFFVFAILFIPFLFLMSLTLGSVQYGFDQTISCLVGECNDSVIEDIVWKLRMPRTIAAIVGGGGLALAGTLLQSLFRNPLASPGILGITSGASLGVALLTMGGLSMGVSAYALGFESIFVTALVGALLTTFLIMNIARFVSNTTTLLLVGLMITWIMTSIISVLGFLAQFHNLQVFYVWTLGSFSGITWDSLGYLAIIVPATSIVSYVLYKRLDASLLGENYATSMGVNAKSLRKNVIILSSVLAAIVTSIAGPVGFIGIAGPYLARLVTNSGTHRIIIPASIIFGALLTLGADILARIVMPPMDLPISVITAVIGAPLVISFLVRRKGEGLSQ